MKTQDLIKELADQLTNNTTTMPQDEVKKALRNKQQSSWQREIST